MGKIYVIAENKRRSSNSVNRSERRNSEHDFIEKEKLDYLSAFLVNRNEKLGEYVNDKERKKLIIVASSFAVFSLIVSVGLTVSNSDKFHSGTPFFNSLILSLIFISGITAINTSLIKYVVSLKLEGIQAVRQMNCLRQAINTVVFAKIEGYLPRTLDENSEDVTDTILDKKTAYWSLYGRHEKYPLNNVSLRSRYKSWKMLFTSSDYSAISAIAIYTIGLIIFPIYYVATNNEAFAKADLVLFISIAVTVLLVSLIIIYKAIDSATQSLHEKLKKDETFPFDNYR